VAYLWDWFQELIDQRVSGFSAGSILYLEIEAWSRLMHIDLAPSEVVALRRIDREFRLYLSEKADPGSSGMGTPTSNNLADGLRDLARARKIEKQKNG
jgi:hypothetical protein